MRPLKLTKQITNRESDSLEMYFKEISCEKLITVDEEAALSRKIKLGDEKAMDKLVKANLRFVVTVAKQFQNRGLPLVDLINEGNIGLIKAVKRYDETRGFKLISYAVWWIRVTIQTAINEQNSHVRLPSNKIAMISKVRRVYIKLEQELQRKPSYEEVGDEIYLSAKVIENIMKDTTRQVSLQAPLGMATDSTLADVLEDTEGENGEQRLINKSFKDAIESALSALTCNEALILRLYFGIGDKKPLTLEEIGDQCGLVADRVRQVKDKAISRLKNNSRFKYLKEYLG